MAKNGNYQEAVFNDYARYKLIRDAEKLLAADYIFVEERNNHPGIDSGSIALTASISNELVLEFERNQTCGKNFKFRLYDKAFMQSPSYRFDSDGSSHCNQTDEPLSKRIVHTPHFHKFIDAGLEIAYQTNDWIDNAEKLLSDISLAFNSFAQEENITHNGFPVIYKNGELIIPPDNTILDPLQGEEFNE